MISLRRRVVEPEYLDSLPPTDPAALANRRDLRRINYLLGNYRWIAAALRKFLRPGDRILEAGAGDGDLGFYLREKVPGLRECNYQGFDFLSRPDGWPKEWGWVSGDFLCGDLGCRPRILVVNLLLHQFSDEQLRELSALLNEVPIWVFCEPLRSFAGLAGLAALRPLGLHPISWHDGCTSVRAGFRGEELVELLASIGQQRHSHVSVDFRGAYRLISCKNEEK